MTRHYRFLLSGLLLCAAAPAHASLPDPVRAVLDAAIAAGSEVEVEAVVRFTKAANPDAGEEIDRIASEYRDARAKEKAEAEEKQKAKLAEATIWQNWKGEGQVGAMQSSGNTDALGLSGGLALARKGIAWDYRFRAQADYQRTNGSTSMERYVVEMEPQYRIDDRGFAYGLGRWESDRTLGYDTRWNASGGLGYKVIDGKAMTLSLKGGPAWRRTEYRSGLSDDELTGLAGLDFGWQLSPSLRLTQVASTLVGERNTSTNSLTALSAKLSGTLSARIAYSAQIDSHPPTGIENVDTQTRFTLVYGF